jgi:8-oxo-dGTP diphosphatase
MTTTTVTPTAKPPKTEVAIAILYQGDQFLLQLRDDIPTIAWPGHWAFFGGHLDPGETPDTAVYRELREEIGYDAPRLELFERVEDEIVVRHVYHGPLVVPVASLVLTEGLDLGLWSVADIRRGQRYSARAGEERPMGPPHQQILLSFLEHRRIEQAAQL